MGMFKQPILFLFFFTLTITQFSSYVDKYSFDNPVQFVTPVTLTEPLDKYIQFKATESTQAASRAVNSATDQREAQALSIDAGLGRIRQNIQFTSSQTSAFASPSNDRSEKLTSIFNFVCKFPLKRVNGKCQCPKNFKFVFGRCISDGSDDNEDNGNNGGDINSGTAQCPLLKINRINKNNPIENLALIQRTYDGKNNNQENEDWGSEGALLERRVQANYQDGISQPITNLPGPRVVSNTIGSQKQPIIKSRVNATIALTIFGQFIDHDIDLTPTQRGNNAQRMDIKIPSGDNFFTQNVIGFSRSQFTQTNEEPRRHPNLVTSWIDGSQIYGSNNVTNCALRAFKNGKLKVSMQGNKEFLPLFNNFFRAGDVRALENMILTSFHTIFLREHNRICDRVLKENSKLNDETVFQIARNYVIGLLQKITLKDFVPILLGDEAYNKIIGQYRGYNNNLNPNIPTQFSTASYRLGHSLLINKIPTINKKGDIIKQFRLNELFFKQNLINENFLEQIMRGASRTLTKEKTSQLVDDVRNLLVLDPSGQVKLDLFSLNIQRGRDHGLPTYNDARSAFGLSRVKTFKQLLPLNEANVAKKLEQIYKKTDNIQLFVGIISQKPLKNAIVGALGSQIVGQTFRNLRDADRFWYEKTFPTEIVDEIDSTTLADIIRRNTQAKNIQDDVFRFNNQANDIQDDVLRFNNQANDVLGFFESPGPG